MFLKKNSSKFVNIKTTNMNCENNQKLNNYFLICTKSKKSNPNINDPSLIKKEKSLMLKKHSISKGKNPSVSPKKIHKNKKIL